MMNKKIIGSILSTSFLCIILISSLFGFFTLDDSAAWFSKNDTVNAGGISVNVLSPGDFEEVKYYRVTEMTIETDNTGGKHNVYSFSYSDTALQYKVPVIGANGTVTETVERQSFNTPIKMRPYSDLGGDCQVLIEITAKTADEFLLYVSTKTEEYLGEMLDAAISDGTFNISPNGLPLTSVVRFSLLTSVDNDTTAKTFSISELDMLSSMYSFTTETDGELTFQNPLAGGIMVTPDAYKKFYIFVDYDPVSVEDITEKIIEYADAATLDAKNNGEVYTDIIVGETNLNFTADFNFTVSKDGQ